MVIRELSCGTPLQEKCRPQIKRRIVKVKNKSLFVRENAESKDKVGMYGD